MKTYGDYFTGFGGMTIGAKMAGLDVLFGVEYDKDLAAVYRRNLGNHVRVEDVTKIDVTTLPYVDIFHASPPCTNASVANANGGESAFDLEMAQSVCRYIAHHKPQVFTMENVYQYRNFESWHEIARALLANGYTYAYWHINTANYGVPQTRKRMIVVARRDGISPSLPEHTHAENPVPELFGTKKRWVSWYEAIEDLIPTLKKAKTNDRIESLHGYEDIPALALIDYQHTAPVKNSDYRRVTFVDKNKPSFTTISRRDCVSYVARIGSVNYESTPRAIARFQSFPDWFELPDKASLAVKGTGNAVPPLFAEMLYKHLAGQ